MRRVAVTGLGAVTPLGHDARSTWDAAVSGRSGVDWIRSFDATAYPIRIASEVKDFDPVDVVGPKEARRLERNVVLAVAAAREAWKDAGVDGVDPARAGILVGSAIGGVMGEGACVLLLEDLERANERGARVYAEILGYGTSNDAHHMAQPDPASIGVAEMMRAALGRAGIEPGRVGYLNAHGTSTPQGDLAETKAIKEVFGDHAYDLAVSSTKSMLGHLFGAAGAVEAMMCVRAIHEGVLPPTINYRTPDPECDLDYVPNEARHTQVDVALSNAMGLGGHNACVLVGRV